MGIMVYSLLRVMQDLYHQPYVRNQTVDKRLRQQTISQTLNDMYTDESAREPS